MTSFWQFQDTTADTGNLNPAATCYSLFSGYTQGLIETPDRIDAEMWTPCQFPRPFSRHSRNADSAERTHRCPGASNNLLLREMLLGLPVSESLGGRCFAQIFDPSSRNRGFRAVATILLLDAQETVGVSDYRRSVRRTGSSSASPTTATRFDPPRHRAPDAEWD